MLAGNLGNSCELKLSHDQPGIGWKFLQSGSESRKKCFGWENEQENSSDILRKKVGNVWNFASEKSWKPCSFGWEMVGDEDLKSWEW